MALLSILVGLSVVPRTVNLEAKVYRLDQLGAVLAGTLAKPVRVAPQLANQTVYIGSGPWGTDELMALVADQYAARWIEVDGTLRLQRDPEAFSVRENAEMGQMQKRWETSVRLEVATPTAGLPLTTPERSKQALSILRIRDLLQVPIGGQAYFSAEPVVGQRSLPALKGMEAEFLVDAAKKYRVEWDRRDRRPGFSLHVLREDAHWWSVVGRIGEVVFFNASFDSVGQAAAVPLILANQPKPKWDLDRLRALELSFDSMDPSTFAVLPQQADFGAILNMEERDPWQSLLEPIFKQLPARSFVALCDPLYEDIVATEKLAAGSWKDIGPLFVSDWTESGGVLRGGPRYPALSQSYQLDRDALQSLIRQDRPAPATDLTELIALAQLNPERHEGLLSPTFLTTYGYRRALMNAGDERLLGRLLRMLGTLSSDQLSQLLAGRPLPYRSLPAETQSQIAQVWFMGGLEGLSGELPKSESDQFIDTLSQVEVPSSEPTTELETAAPEPTIEPSVPNPQPEIPTIYVLEREHLQSLRGGVPANASLRLRSRKMPLVQLTDWGRLELDPLRFLTPVEASLLKMFTSLPESTMISPMVPKFSHGIPAERTELFFELMFDEKRGERFRVDLSRPTGPRVPWGQLPAEFLADFRRAEQAMSKLRDLMPSGDGAPPSDAPPVN